MRRQSFLRWSRWGLLVLVLGGAILLLRQSQPAKAPARSPLDLSALPLAFEANTGQSDPAVRFVAHIPQGALFFTTNQVVLTLQNDACAPGGAGCPAVDHTPLCAARAGRAAPAPPNVLRLRFEDALPTVTLTASMPLAGQVNYLVGTDPNQWHTQVPIYGTMTYAGLYPHINLEYHGAGARLKGTYQVAPGGDPAEIRWRYDGAGPPVLDSGGALVIPLTGSPWVVTEQPPVAWQERAGQRSAVAVHYAVDAEGAVGFALGAYDPALPLTIDPTLTYSTYLGGAGAESGWAVAVDSAGNAYITGATNSANFPVQNAYQPQYGGGTNDAFVAKLNADGSALVYATYLGGSGEDMGLGLMVDAAGDVYVAGSAGSLNFPLVNPVQATYGGGNSDAFLAELNPSGTALLYSTYLGGNYDDCTVGVALGPGGTLYTAGYTASTTFPVVQAIQPASGGGWDAFVTKLAPGGGSLLYSTYLGGSSYEFTSIFALDSTGAVYITGNTASPNFPLAQPLQAVSGGGEDAFVTKINPSGSALVYSTYLGGSGADEGWGIALDAAGAVYVQGKTFSPDFPLRNPLQAQYGGRGDAFVAKLNPAGSALVYATYLGGSGLDDGRGIAVDSTGAATLGGTTASPDFPLVNPLQPAYGGQVDAYLAQLNPAGTALTYATFLGGSGEEDVCGVAVDASGNAYLTGWTDSRDFPTHNAVQPANGGWYDAFVVKVHAPPATPTATATRTPPARPRRWPRPPRP